MNLESQVTSLELSKKLKELEVKQESLFYWIKKDKYRPFDSDKKIDDDFIIIFSAKQEYLINEDNEDIVESYGCGCCSSEYMIHEKYSAFTASELGQMLPSEFNCPDDGKLSLIYEKTLNNIWLTQTLYEGGKGVYVQDSSSEADSRAKMLIYLLENNLIDVKDINNDK
jgi:hypothetical protein